MSKMKSLSKREQDVIMLLKAGNKSVDVARILDINQKTVSTYIMRTYLKFGIDKSKNIYYLITKLIELDKLKR
jgi:DNA-binding CsgD family transcriptional regulator